MNKEQRLIFNNLLFKYNFKESQMEQIRLGLEHEIDVSPYLNPNIEWQEMERIRLELERNNE